jgi:hypothetical protein
MSEYEIVRFRAIDRPLSDKQLAFMDRQSSRAECTRWDFQVEYHYGSFRGDVNAMLRNGYDIFLTYSNYGTREIRMRLPNGLPFPQEVWSQYVSLERFLWHADRDSNAGILEVSPFLEDAQEAVWEFDDYLDAAAAVREMLISGDLRALYVLWLCVAIVSRNEEEDSNPTEPPVPHGLGSCPAKASSLLGFFDADPLLIDAAAAGIPDFKATNTFAESANAWRTALSDAQRDAILERLISEDPVALKAELLAEIRESHLVEAWPVAPPARTLTQLMDTCSQLRRINEEEHRKQLAAQAKRAAARAEKQRQARMVEMKADPNRWLQHATELVEKRGTDNYREAASILADLREALGGDAGNDIARRHAKALARTHPTLRTLVSALRKQALLD